MVYAQAQPKVEYGLTDIGKAAQPGLHGPAEHVLSKATYGLIRGLYVYRQGKVWCSA